MDTLVYVLDLLNAIAWPILLGLVAFTSYVPPMFTVGVSFFITSLYFIMRVI